MFNVSIINKRRISVAVGVLPCLLCCLLLLRNVWNAHGARNEVRWSEWYAYVQLMEWNKWNLVKVVMVWVWSEWNPSGTRFLHLRFPCLNICVLLTVRLVSWVSLQFLVGFPGVPPSCTPLETNLVLETSPAPFGVPKPSFWKSPGSVLKRLSFGKWSAEA